MSPGYSFAEPHKHSLPVSFLPVSFHQLCHSGPRAATETRAMSSRQLRKLQRQKEHVAEATQEEAESSEDDDVTKRSNAFASLSLFSQANNESEAGEEDEEEAPETSATAAAESVQIAASSSNTKAKRKKKKKKAKKAQAGATAGVEEVDELDKALAELNLLSPKEGGPGATRKQPANNADDLADLLKIDVHDLNVMNEMRAVFGRGAVEAATTEQAPPAVPQDQAEDGEQRVDLETFLRAPPLPPSAHRSVSDVVARRNPFGRWKATWPSAPAGGLTMKAVSAGDAPNKAWIDTPFSEFTFAHDRTYEAKEQAFHQFIVTHDSQGMLYFLKAHPYHVSSLIQVSNIAKHQDRNMALAADLCERALYTFGRVTLSTFRKKLEEGKARLSFYRPENRQFWLAAYHYVKSLMPKGAYRTALEWTKLLLSLSPDDPYSIIVWVHALAIRAHASQWFLDLCDSDVFGTAFPNPLHPYVRQTAVLAKLQLQDTDGARTALDNGIRALPWLYGALFSALNLDTPKAIWGIQPRNDSEVLATKLYLSTAKDLWNNTQAVALLKEVGNDLPTVDVAGLDRGQPIPLNVARFVYLEGTPDLLALLPQVFLQAKPNYDSDPLPPERELNCFSNETQRLPWAAGVYYDGDAPLPVPVAREDAVANGGDAAANDDDDPAGGQGGFLRRLMINLLWARTPEPAGAENPQDAHPRDYDDLDDTDSDLD